MQAITEAARQRLPVGIALVMDNDKNLLGTVTDGDIRKALVRGVTMDESVEQIMARNPITVSESLSIDEMMWEVTEKVRSSGRINDYKVDKVIITNGGRQVVDVLDFYELWTRRDVKKRKICVVGTGHVGLTLMVAMAELGYDVAGFDINEVVVDRLNKGEITFFEKGLQPLLKFHLKEENIRFCMTLPDRPADVYLICVGTPIDEKTQKPITDFVERAARDIAQKLKKGDLVILRSTVTVGTTRNIVKPILEKESSLKAGLDFDLAFAPERTVEGNALEEIKRVPQIIGGINKKSSEEATRLFQTICASCVILDSLEESEMIKLINNTYRDYSFAFANKLVSLCERLKMDTQKILKAASEGYPRNPIPLPSPGVGGYCLTKDPFLMASVAQDIGIDPDIFVQSRRINSAMPQFVADRVMNFINQYYAEENKIKIYCMGLAFKGYPETSDMRGSPAIDVINILKKDLNSRLIICGYDPIVDKQDIEELEIKYQTLRDGFKNAHCVLLMNNHPDFGNIDIYSLLEMMKTPRLLFDGWRFFFPEDIKKVDGVIYQGLGGF
jgi:nucleotide sugar dehydrogenase